MQLMLSLNKGIFRETMCCNAQKKRLMHSDPKNELSIEVRSKSKIPSVTGSPKLASSPFAACQCSKSCDCNSSNGLLPLKC